MNKTIALVITFVFFGTVPLSADVSGIDLDFAARMNRMEAETQALRAELEYLRANPVRLPYLQANPVGMSTENVQTPQDDVEYFSLEELRSAMKGLVWTKGNFKIVPYGILWGNMVYETARTHPASRSYTVWVPSADVHGEHAFMVDGRTTRIGLDVSGPRLWQCGCAASGGKVEIDFQGSFAGTENKGGVLLRHAYWEIKNENFRILFGQTWDVISPLIPGTALYTILWDAGNIGYRRAQLRGERYLAFSDTFLLTLQGSLNQNIFCDSCANIQGETGGWPILEGRTAVTLGYRDKYGRPITFGVSGHIGEQGFDFAGMPAMDDVRRRTWSINADVKIPIADWWGFQGEFFTGENLGAFLGGIGQGINPVTLNTIRSNGGWFELYGYWLPQLHSHVGYSIDDPIDADVTAGRIYNQAYFGNIIYDVTSKFTMGFEVSSWKTLYDTARPGESVRFEFMGKYGF